MKAKTLLSAVMIFIPIVAFSAFNYGLRATRSTFLWAAV